MNSSNAAYPYKSRVYRFVSLWNNDSGKELQKVYSMQSLLSTWLFLIYILLYLVT